MKKVVILIFTLCSLAHTVSSQNTWYVAAQSGLRLRKLPDPNSETLTTVPYGQAIEIKIPEYSENMRQYTFTYESEGFQGSWWETTYQGKKGYIFSAFLFPVPPPKKEHYTLFQYTSSSGENGIPVTIKKHQNHDGDAPFSIIKHLTRSGISYTEASALEYASVIYSLPGFDLEQAFHLIRILPEFQKYLKDQVMFPSSKEWSNESEDDPFTIQLVDNTRIEMRWPEGCGRYVNIYRLGFEIIIEDIEAC